MYSIFEEEDENAAAQHNQQRGMVPFRSIEWKNLKLLIRSIAFLSFQISQSPR